MPEEFMNLETDFIAEPDDAELEETETLMDEGEFEDDIDFEALGINPETPTQAKPGSEEKVLMLSARYAAGLPLWDNNDRYDHAPGHSAFSGLKFEA